MRLPRSLPAAALATVLAACGADKTSTPDAFAAATPDVTGLTLELQGGGAEGTALATALVAPAPQDDLQNTQAALHELNATVTAFVGRLADVVAAGGPPAGGDTKSYGPAVRCVVGTDPSTCTTAELLLTVTHVRDEVYRWALSAWATGGDPAGARVVAAGWLAKGPLDHRGVGRLVIDLDHLASVVPAFPGQGVLLAGFANGPAGKAAVYRLRGFTPDAAAHGPVHLTLAGFKNAATGTARVRVATVAELVAPASGTDAGPELLRTAFAWNPAVGGRSFAIVSNWENPIVGGPFGDVPYTTAWNERYFFVRSCYDTGAALVFRERFECDGPGASVPQTPADCAATYPGTVVFPASPTADDTWANRCALDLATHPAYVPPTGVPATDPDDGAAEGDGLGDLTPPPAPPADATDVAPPAA